MERCELQTLTTDRPSCVLPSSVAPPPYSLLPPAYTLNNTPALSKLGLKKIEGINRVVLRRPKGPEVFKGNSDCYIVFGEAKVEDSSTAGFGAHQIAQAEAQAAEAKAQAERAAAASAIKGGDADEDDEDDEEGVEAADIEVIVGQVGCSRGKAAKALRANKALARPSLPPPPAPMTVVDQTNGSELDRLWQLLTELSAQLSHNRQQTEELHRRAEELKTQAIHTQTGFTLRRFNTDVSQEEFESELERLNVSLVLENQGLQQENRQLSVLLKDYEGTLEAVMAKFRAHAHATQQHHLDLVRHYESILLSLPTSLPSPDSSSDSNTIDPLHLQLSLAHLASLIRKALRSLQGEDPEDSTSPLIFPAGNAASASTSAATAAAASISGVAAGLGLVGAEAEELEYALPLPTQKPARDESEGGYIGKSASTNPHYIPTTSTSSLVASPPKEGEKPLPKVKKLGPLDEALEREVEIEALRRENEELRRLLGISGELESASA
ncbi:hypothetical protein MNV49_007158 [Pseudohyphozyma bogoriensis]|nr:hypothetical protein MNV49_007158 [Pseudohyphozyma bogoriensis]